MRAVFGSGVLRVVHVLPAKQLAALRGISVELEEFQIRRELVALIRPILRRTQSHRRASAERGPSRQASGEAIVV